MRVRSSAGYNAMKINNMHSTLPTKQCNRAIMQRSSPADPRSGRVASFFCRTYLGRGVDLHDAWEETRRAGLEVLVLVPPRGAVVLGLGEREHELLPHQPQLVYNILALRVAQGEVSLHILDIRRHPLRHEQKIFF